MPRQTDPGDDVVFADAYERLERLLAETGVPGTGHQDIEVVYGDCKRNFTSDPSLAGERVFRPSNVHRMYPEIEGIYGIQVNVDLSLRGKRYIAPEDVAWAKGIYPDFSALLRKHRPNSGGLVTSDGRIFRPWYSIHFVPGVSPFMFLWLRKEANPDTLVPDDSRGPLPVPLALSVMAMLERPAINLSASQVTQLMDAIEAVGWENDPWG